MRHFSPYSNEGRQLYLAYWFDRLVRHLLVSKKLSPKEWLESKSLKHFDIDHEGLNHYVEVKGSSNMDQLKLFEDQLDYQLGELGFPVDSGFVWIFSYRNRTNEGQRRKRLLKRNHGGSHKKLSAFLAKQTNLAFVLDINLLDWLRRSEGTSRYTRDKFRERNLIRLNRTKLKLFAGRTRDALMDLGLSEEDIRQWLPPKAGRIRSRMVETEMDGHTIRFKLFPLLPNGPKRRLLKWLNGVVKKGSQ